jgi:hypothetical protein
MRNPARTEKPPYVADTIAIAITKSGAKVDTKNMKPCE